MKSHMTRRALAIAGLVGVLAIAAITWSWTRAESARTSFGQSGQATVAVPASDSVGAAADPSDAGSAVNGSTESASPGPASPDPARPTALPPVHAELSAPGAMITLPPTLTASAPTPSLALAPLGVYNTGVVGKGAAEVVGYDEGTQRAFVTNAASNRVDILDIRNPDLPIPTGKVDTSRYGESPTSVDVHDGIVAIAVKSADSAANGYIVFADANGNTLAAVEAGVRPDMVTFTPDGLHVLAADEGEPSPDYRTDPEGSITIVDLRNGVDGLRQSDVAHVSFRAFNNMSLDPTIRIFGPGASVAQDLEPEYIAVTPDSSRAYVTLQENNALAVVDIARGLVVELIPLGFKDHSRPFVTGLRNYEFPEMPVVGATPAGQELRLGGFSGLLFEGVDKETGELLFLTHTDRGPNADSVDLDDDGKDERPFALPDFNPVLVHFALDPRSGTITLREEIHLKDKDGRQLTGLPNVVKLPGIPRADEPPVDLLGHDLPVDPSGVDLEAVVHAADGTWWMGDEYRPSLLHFDADGRLIERYVPSGSNEDGNDFGVEALPAALAQRQDNRGFEALALDGTMLYAFMQSPIDNPASDGDVNAESSRWTRLIAFDTEKAETVGEYLYLLEGGDVDKLGDAVALGNGEFLVLERDDVAGPDARKYIYRISLEGATNLLEGSARRLEGPDQGLEILSEAELASAGIRPVLKRLFVDLTAAGYELLDKPEGMALVDSDTVALINDDDFGIAGGFDPATGALDPNPNPFPSVLTLISLKATALDASDKDGGIHFTNPPVLGMFQPDAIGAYDVAGKTYLVTANEGDARAYKGFDEQTRVRDIALDPSVFPDAESLQRDENLGRLRTTTAAGSAGNDPNGDGLAERILAFGARSISIWDADANLVWDSGDELERITARLLPEEFNSGEENGTFDTRSDVSGPEPEGLALGTVDGRTYAFVGLERIGGVIVYDITEPFAPQYVTYATTRDFQGDAEAGTAGDLSPEGLVFVSGSDSPTGEPLLLVANEFSGSTRVFAVQRVAD